MDVLLRPLSGISFFSPGSSSFPTSQKDGPPTAIDGRRKRKVPSALNKWVSIFTITIMILLAVGIEVALHFSQKKQGFDTGHFTTERVQFLSGFLPTLLVGPLVWMWRRVDNAFKRLQPYVNMSKGPVRPEQSVLLDLEHANIVTGIKKSFKLGQYIILVSSSLVLLNILLHPMAGSFFLVKPGVTRSRSPIPADSFNIIGLNPQYKDITPFVAAAGFAEAAAFHNLSDPPFIQGPWAVAQFKFPLDGTRNFTVTVNTTGIETDVHCTVPSSNQLSPPAGGSTNWTLRSSLGQGTGCDVTLTIDVSVSANQYGVQPLPSCSLNGDGHVFSAPFSPAFFWFYTNLQSGPQARSIFCAPAIEAHTVEATLDGSTGLLTNVTKIGDIDPNTNNVTSGGFAGNTFNGISFDSDSDFNLTNVFVAARALAVQSGLPGSIFRFASDPNGPLGGLEAVFNNPSGFLDLTQKIYTQYLSLSALSNYFVEKNNPIDADVTLWPQRLWINERNAHCLAALLLLVAITGGVLQIIHSRQRRNIYLATRPGSMAHYMALVPTLSASAGANEPTFLSATDSKKAIRRKLDGIEFLLDQQTGRIVPVIPVDKNTLVASQTPRDRASWRGSRMTQGQYELVEDPEKGLLDRGYQVEPFTPMPEQRGPSGS